MPDDMADHFVLPNFTTALPGMLREVLENYTTTRDKNFFNGLGMKKVESGGTSMMLKTGMEVSQDYTVFNFRPQIPQKDLKYHSYE